MKTKSFPCSVVTIYDMQRGKKLTRGQRSYRPAVTRVMILMTLCTTECCGIYLIDVWPKGAHGLALRSMPYLKTLKDALFHKCFQNTPLPFRLLTLVHTHKKFPRMEISYSTFPTPPPQTLSVWPIDLLASPQEKTRKVTYVTGSLTDRHPFSKACQ